MRAAKHISVLVIGANVEALVDILKTEASIDVALRSGRGLLRPDVVILYADMDSDALVPKVKELIGEHNGVPVIVVCPSVRRWQRMDVISAGATDYIVFAEDSDAQEMARERYRLIFSVKNAVGVRDQKIKAQHSQSIPLESADWSGRHGGNPTVSERPFPFQGIIALGGSLGGTEAFLTIAKRLSPRIPGMVVVLHMPPVFTRMYAERLNSECAVHVYEAHDKEAVRPGTVLIAPGAMHMRVEKQLGGFVVRCAPGPKITGHCPSVDALFESVAKNCGRQAVGIILTGMGDDGARGMLSMRRKGAYTIGQDKESSFCYGMPKEAYEMGAVTVQSPLNMIPDVLHKRLMMP